MRYVYAERRDARAAVDGMPRIDRARGQNDRLELCAVGRATRLKFDELRSVVQDRHDEATTRSVIAATREHGPRQSNSDSRQDRPHAASLRTCIIERGGGCGSLTKSSAPKGACKPKRADRCCEADHGCGQ